ncbi:mitochondrial import inner membrane translocase subunit tim21 [Ciborinia camelliae]|nr:mitochondrial import inner membrane translocase subunit tim21 [Ciborinia camelliae]
MLPSIRAVSLFSLPSSVRPLLAARLYATHTGLGTTNTSSQPKRKAVTTFNDDGRVPWRDLSGREKVARTTQQTFNLGIVLIGTALTGGVIYLLYTEVFAPEGKINQFNRAADQVKKDPRCIEILGNGKKIRAYGEPTSGKWARAGPIASNITKDHRGVEHLVMHFNVEGPLNHGVVNLHMVRRPSESEFVYKYLFLDVKGHQRIYLENADATNGPGKNKSRFLGITWR